MILEMEIGITGGVEDGHKEAPAADRLAAQPCPEEAREGRVEEANDAADAGRTFDAREDGTSGTASRTRCLRSTRVSLSGLRSGGSTPSATKPRAAASEDPVGDDHAANDPTDRGVRSVRRVAAHEG